jgi:hypothetical protein
VRGGPARQIRLPGPERNQYCTLIDRIRYRITEGSEEIQMRKVAGFLFGYMGPKQALS